MSQAMQEKKDTHQAVAPTMRPSKVRIITANIIVVFASAIASIIAAIAITPATTISPFGQKFLFRLEMPNFSWSGPGFLDNAGIITPSVGVSFPGPFRPVLIYPEIIKNTANGNAAAELVQGKIPRGYSLNEIKAEFFSGAASYFIHLAITASLLFVSVVTAITLIGLVWGKLHRSWFTWLLWALPVILVATCGLIGSGVNLAVHAGQNAANKKPSIAAVFGVDPLPLPPAVVTRDTTTGIVVLGDSVPAGNGLTLGPNPSFFDKACGRSTESYASVLQIQLKLKVKNLGCASATIQQGIYGAQLRSDRLVNPQLSELLSMRDLRMIDINIGADDASWSTLFGICYLSPECNDKVVSALFKQALGTFRTHEYQMLNDIDVILARLDHQVAKVVNVYYNPFGMGPGATYDCNQLTRSGPKGNFTAAKASQISGYLNEVNNVIRTAATIYGFSVAEVDFTGHALCDGVKSHQDPDRSSPTGYVQPLNDPGGDPVHPTSAGQLMIGLAVIAALPSNWADIRNGLPQKPAEIADGNLSADGAQLSSSRTAPRTR